MRATEIRAYREKIVIRFEGACEGQALTVRARVPLVCGQDDPAFTPGRTVYEARCSVSGGCVTVPRHAGKTDLMVYRFECGCEGVCYVTEVEPEVSAFHDPYPVRPMKAINCHALDEDLDELGFAQTSIQWNQALFMVSGDCPNAIPYEYDGETYYFNRAEVENVDAQMQRVWRRGITAVQRHVNASFLAGEKADQRIVDIVQHPGYDYDYPAAYMSAYNLRTEAGFKYFCAFIDHMLSRYCRPDHKYGWMTGFETGNEVTSQYIWNNAGEMTCAEYMREYTEIMRISWLLAMKHWSNFRVFTSFDQYFNGCHVPSEPKRFYGMKECIDEIQKNCDMDGNFPWNVAFHPYPENLSYPDFWNDREPNWTFETRRITFKNLEVMPAYLKQEHLLYKGEVRHIILPEQGFNSRTDAPYTLLQGKYGYVLAYQKMKKLGTIDMFLHHNYVDGPWEFGLNLGIRYCGGYDENNREIIAGRKPICEAIAAMDTEREADMVAEARAYIGEEIYDYMMDPPEVTAGADHSKDGLNIPGQGNRRATDKAKAEGTKANFDT